MTRINQHIEPYRLTDSHLLSEYREIKRIPNCIKSGRAKIKNIPDKFKLNKGHVKFYYDKLKFIEQRIDELYNECKKRNFNVQDYRKICNGIPDNLMNDVVFDNNAIILLHQRISERLSEMDPIRYYGKVITYQQAIKILKNN